MGVRWHWMMILVVGMVLPGLSCRDRSNRPQVVLYCSVDQGIAEPIVAAFEKQTGIKVRARYDTEASKTVGLVQRIRAEAAAPAADVFWSGEIFHTIRLAREGLLAPYRSMGVSPMSGSGVHGQDARDTGIGSEPMNHRQDADATEPRGHELAPAQAGDAYVTKMPDGGTLNWSVAFADPNGCWYGFGLRGRVIGYNTNRVPAAEAPKALEEVLDPKWKGRLVIASPAFGTTGGDVASWFAHYGPDRAREILRKLKDNGVRIVAGNSTAVRMMATGQADVCFTDTDDIYAGQRNGWPVAMHFLDQGGDGVLAIPNTAALIKGGPNPENAQVLMRFLLGEELERMLVQSDSHNSPVHAQVAQEYPQYAIPKPLPVDYGRVADFLQEAIQTAREILE
jgi:iron(III) transport system substrate-binding protein